MRIDADASAALLTDLLVAVGSPRPASALVADVLVRASLVGHDSHGVMRLPSYVDLVETGRVRPAAEPRVIAEHGCTAVLEGQGGWGPVVAKRAMDMAIARGQQTGMAAVAVRGCSHVGRVGEYVEMAARRDMIGLAFVNSYGGGESVVPWGGRDRRLTPNPVAFAAPGGSAPLVLVDVTTSVLPEGKVRWAFQNGAPLPQGCIVDSEGRPATDPGRFYDDPPGALLPLGGVVGHKGTALAVAAELLAGILSGAGQSGGGSAEVGNGLLFMAMDIAAFVPLAQFVADVERLRRWVKSSRPAPGFSEVLFPGEPEEIAYRQRRREGIPVRSELWQWICAKAESLRVPNALLPGD